MLGSGWFPDRLGGLERYFRGLLEALPEDSTRGVVVGPARDAPSRIQIASDHRQPLPGRALTYARKAFASAKGVDLVDAHFALYAFLPSLLGPLRGRPWVVHFHGPWADECVAQGDRSQLGYHVRRALERRVYQRAQRVFVLSAAFRREVVERYGVRPWLVDVVPPGIDLDEFSPGSCEEARLRLGVNDSGFLAVCVRRLVPRMGIEYLLAAWAAAVQDLPSGSRLLIAGDGILREDLEDQIRQLGIDRTAQILGRVDERTLVDLYRAADVGVVPTLEHEGFGLVVVEAAACGTPSIVTNVGALPQVANGLDRSLVVPPADAKALEARLRTAALTGDLPTPEEAKRYAQQFAWSDVAQLHLPTYRSILEGEPDSRLRVVYLDHVAQLSGGELALLRLLPHMTGVQPHVILAEDGPLVERLDNAGISVEVLPLDNRVRALRKDDVNARALSPRAVLSATLYTLRLARRLRRLGPDLVHTNSLKSGVYGSVAGRLAGVPVIWHVRDSIEEDYLPRFAVRLVRWMVQRFPTAVVANSDHTAQTIVGNSPSKIASSVVPAVVPEVAQTVPGRSRPRRKTRTLTFGMVGRIAPWKGQDVFLRAFASAFVDGQERAVVVGAPLFGEEAYDEEVRRLSRALGVADRVEFRGFQEDIEAELAQIDVLVHASVTPEPFGQVLVEGLAFGVPVIASDGGGASEIISDGENGLLHPCGDAARLADLMVRLRDEPALRSRLAEAGQRRAADFSPEIVVGKMMTVYERVARRGRAESGPAGHLRRRAASLRSPRPRSC